MPIEEQVGYYVLFAFVMVLMYWQYIAVFVTILILAGQYIKYLKRKKKQGNN